MKHKRLNAVIASILIHLIIAAIIGLFISDHYWTFNGDGMDVRFVNPTATRDTIRRTHRRLNPSESQKPVNPLQVHIPANTQLSNSDTSLNITSTTPMLNTDILDSPDTSTPTLRTEVQRPDRTSQRTPVRGTTTPSIPTRIKTQSTTPIRPELNTSTNGAFAEFVEGPLTQDGLRGDFDSAIMQNPVMLPQGELGAILEGSGDDLRGHIRIIRLKHSLSDWWQDPTALPALMKWMDKHTSIRTDMNYQGGSLKLTDPRILNAPLIVMTGHDKDITVGRRLVKDGPLQTGFTETERAALRKYIVDEGGMLFFDDCGFHGLFAHIVAEELERIFPDYPLEILPHEHEIYTIYYHLKKPPNGGDVFWGNENNAQPTQFRYQKGIIVDGRLAVIFNRKDYMCAMETAEIESRTMLRLRRSTDVYRFMTNLIVYTLKYGGNTDRSGYKE